MIKELNFTEIFVQRENDYSFCIELKKEIEKGQYTIFLQPKCNFNKNIQEAEALVRYIENEHIIGPDEFIPIFEKKKLISQIDLFVFEKVCQLLHQWKQNHFHIIPISFNFSRQTLDKSNLIFEMEIIRQKYDISPNFLIIEITETSQLQNTDKEKQIIEELKQIGYSLSLDDFGVDYSNLKSFIEYPFSSIKIDKGLVDIVETNWKDQVVMENIIDVCHQLKKKVVVEGVENQKQYDFFKEKNCDLVQGYYIDHPLSIEAFEKKYMLTYTRRKQNVKERDDEV